MKALCLLLLLIFTFTLTMQAQAPTIIPTTLTLTVYIANTDVSLSIMDKKGKSMKVYKLQPGLNLITATLLPGTYTMCYTWGGLIVKEGRLVVH